LTATLPDDDRVDVGRAGDCSMGLIISVLCSVVCDAKVRMS